MAARSAGGHYENLGLVELLRRGCTKIYCFDASGGKTCAALGDAIALARSELRVDIAIDRTTRPPTSSTRTRSSRPTAHSAPAPRKVLDDRPPDAARNPKVA